MEPFEEQTAEINLWNLLFAKEDLVSEGFIYTAKYYVEC
jgi:hypothetical protein